VAKKSASKPQRAVSNAAKVADLLEQVTRQIQAAGFVDGLKPAQWSVLRFVEKAPQDQRTITHFAAYHAVSKSSASQTTRLLIRKGLLKYQASQEDKRVRYLSLSAKGASLLRSDPLDLMGKALKKFADRDLSAAAKFLGGLLEHLGKANG
jgi:DNA-binding MarR family transcriptional regulator